MLNKSFGEAPLLTVCGGKLTTYRRLAEDALSRLDPFFPPSSPWTARTPLPGGDFAYDAAPSLVERAQRKWPFLSEDQARRLVGAYGTRLGNVFAGVAGENDLGIHFGAGLTAVEVQYLMTKEWAATADDILWRRSKLGLRFSPAERAALERYLAELHGG